jgi:ComF family protein
MLARLREFSQKTKPLFAKATDTLFPPRCPACAESVTSQGALCADCWRDMHFITTPMCHRCGLPFEYGMGAEMLCGRCMETPPAFTRAVSVFRYDDKSRPQVLAFKFHDRTQLAPFFGAWLARAGAEFTTLADVIVPVPLHYRRLLSRRYNQAALLAHVLANLTGLPLLPHTLQRKKSTAAQSGLSHKGREDNVRGAFHVPKKLRRPVKGKAVLLVDDVMTTGATMNACARALRDAGAKDVYALTLARTVLTE